MVTITVEKRKGGMRSRWDSKARCRAFIKGPFVTEFGWKLSDDFHPIPVHDGDSASHLWVATSLGSKYLLDPVGGGEQARLPEEKRTVEFVAFVIPAEGEVAPGLGIKVATIGSPHFLHLTSPQEFVMGVRFEVSYRGGAEFTKEYGVPVRLRGRGSPIIGEFKEVHHD
ncbi:MAG: hypothetical protein KGI98_00200 [Euryarchaeota archaeon]|nr:hypothetical protein [Euryarchaeota archaeon]MDE1880351.1 hypothetical protein [Euryarchaeota archaeon]